MTDTADREEAVVRVRAYVESWEGFEPSVTISDERDPNSLYLGDLRLLLPGGEGGSVASLPVMTADELAKPSEVRWRCFHCDEEFADTDAAAEHFGRFEDCAPICKVGADRFRQMEDELASWRSESDTASKEFYGLGAKHSTALREAEQQGYDRGLADGRALRRQKVSAAPNDCAGKARAKRSRPNTKAEPEQKDQS